VRFSASELASHLDAALVGPDVTIDGTGIDSRSIRPGQLFVPIVAERDGHDFIPSALGAGAVAYMTRREPEGATAIRVDDTAVALMNLGALGRARVGGVIGITGSVGKTTTKDLLRACLATTFSTAASERSYNNELGLPLTLLNARDDARWVVLEMGARGVGHIKRLALVARPEVGIVTSVAMAHVEFFGDIDAVARAKSELVTSLPPTGVAVLNFDDPRVGRMAALSPSPVLGYATDADAEVRAESIELDTDLRARFMLVTPWGKGEVRLALHGVHQVRNALAAAAAALWCDVPFERVVTALTSATGAVLRMEVRRRPHGPALIVDCYNANPASTEAALGALAALEGVRKVALLGLMAELGSETATEHRRVASLADDLGIELVGYQTDLYGAAQVSGVVDAVELLRSLAPGDAALVKGSRVTQLEDVVAAYESRVGSVTG
jgi:UDP-N-acetylmuramoyl-tripeptide--D-alanyl-D-alanine ligase